MECLSYGGDGRLNGFYKMGFTRNAKVIEMYGILDGQIIVKSNTIKTVHMK